VFCPDRKTILTAGEDGTARLWDAAIGAPRSVPLRRDGPVMALAFSPNGRTIVTGSYDSTTRLWDAATDQPQGQPMPYRGRVQATVFTSDEQLLESGRSKEEVNPRSKRQVIHSRAVRLWRAATGERVGDSVLHRQSV
jgi:WD40 repeat protein